MGESDFDERRRLRRTQCRYSWRCEPPEILELEVRGIEALIAIGSDGSFAILRRMAVAGGIRPIGIPKTIGNDVGVTEFSVG